jgi:hypothetical protein
MDQMMAQLGLNSIGEINPNIFWNPPSWELPLRAHQNGDFREPANQQVCRG